MAELNFKKLADAPILEEVPDGAKVYAEVDGKVYRVAGDNLGGGGIPTAIIVRNNDNNDKFHCDNMTFNEVKTLLEADMPVMATISAVYYEDHCTFISNQIYFSAHESPLNTIIIKCGTAGFKWQDTGAISFYP